MQGRILLIAALGAAAALTLLSPAIADDRICRGAIGAITVDNLKVPAGATCKLNRTRVEGNVIVNRRATLRATRARVDGNVQAEGAALVHVADSTVGGSIQLKQGRRGGTVLRNRVESDIQLFSNRGAFTVTGNRVDGNLQCKSNRPRPRGGRNRVEGNKEAQCARLWPSAPADGTAAAEDCLASRPSAAWDRLACEPPSNRMGWLGARRFRRAKSADRRFAVSSSSLNINAIRPPFLSAGAERRL